MAIDLDVQLTEKDHLAATYLHLRQPRLRRLFHILIFVLYCALFIAVILDYLLGRGDVVGLIICILIGFWFAGIRWLYLPWASRRYFRQYRLLQQMQHFSASKEGICIRAEHGENQLGWDVFFRWIEGKELFLLYLNGQQFLNLPKRCFITEGDVTEFRELLQTKMPGGKNKR